MYYHGGSVIRIVDHKGRENLEKLSRTMEMIKPLDRKAMADAQARQGILAKPPGSLVGGLTGVILGAALGLFLSETAARILAEMATFTEAGVSEGDN